MNETTTQPTEKIETETCGRCGGSGRHSWCQAYGDKCFGCSGSGRKFTKRGLLANYFLTFIRSKRADAIVVGDLVRADFGCPIGGQVRSFGKVTESYMSTTPGGTTNGQPVFYYVLTISSKYGGVCNHTTPATLYRVGQSGEQKVATFMRAIEFQNKLTKAGKPAKKTVLTAEEKAYLGV